MSLPTPTLHSARLRLRPFDDADADALFALHSNAHVLRYWDAPPWSDRVRAERFLTACRQMAEEGTGARLVVERVSDGAFLGWCSLTRWNPDHRSASLGYCFDDAAWGHGSATEAARALLRWAFDTLDLNRVQAEADTRNVASARVLEKLGFVREGMLRQDCVVNGEVSDSWVFGLIRREWRPSAELGSVVSAVSAVETLGSRQVYANPWMTVREDTIRRPDGSTGIYGVVDTPDIGLVIPADGDRLHLVEQYRHPVAGRRWEFPSGTADQPGDENGAALAARELREETGLIAGSLTFLGTLDTMPSTLNQRCRVYLATDLTEGPSERDLAEQDMRSAWFTRADVARMIAAGTISDAKTLAAYTMLLLP